MRMDCGSSNMSASDDVFQKRDLLGIILGYALGKRSNIETIAPAGNSYGNRLFRTVRALETELFAVREGMRCVAQWRLVNRLWKDLLDDSSSRLWYQAAKSLLLEPPERLYSNGSYQEVCRLLLKDKFLALENARDGLGRRHRITACMMMPPHTPPPHPNPERPLRFTDAIVNSIHANTKALNSFLSSINYSVREGSTPRRHETAMHEIAGKPENHKGWSQSAWTRYRMFLFLKKKYPDTWLIPTADIEFCWLAHIFRTEAYWGDMTDLKIHASHSLLLNRGEQAAFLQATEATAALWEQEFPGLSYLPVDISLTQFWQEEHREQRLAAEGNLSYRFYGAVQIYGFLPKMGALVHLSGTHPLQKQLPTIRLTAVEICADLEWFPELQRGMEIIWRSSYDVLGYGRDYDKLYRKHLIPSYERFLNLCYQMRLTNIAPPYVLDLVWHAHQLDPVAYRRDCMEMLGREVRHHPWPNGLGVSTPLSSDFQCAWKQAYGSSIEEDWKLSLPSETT